MPNLLDLLCTDDFDDVAVPLSTTPATTTKNIRPRHRHARREARRIKRAERCARRTVRRTRKAASRARASDALHRPVWWTRLLRGLETDDIG